MYVVNTSMTSCTQNLALWHVQCATALCALLTTPTLATNPIASQTSSCNPPVSLPSPFQPLPPHRPSFPCPILSGTPSSPLFPRLGQGLGEDFPEPGLPNSSQIRGRLQNPDRPAGQIRPQTCFRAGTLDAAGSQPVVPAVASLRFGPQLLLSRGPSLC